MKTITEPKNSIGTILKNLEDGEGIVNSLRLESIMEISPATPVTCEILEEEDIACLLFTGGTTGLPKGAMISHRMICWNVLNTVIHDLHHDDIYL